MLTPVTFPCATSSHSSYYHTPLFASPAAGPPPPQGLSLINAILPATPLLRPLLRAPACFPPRSLALPTHFHSAPDSPEASDMCTGKCARCLGLSLIPLSLVCIVANALLLVPDGKTTWTDGNLSLQVWLMGGFIGGGLMVRMLEHQPAGDLGTELRDRG